MKPDYEQMRRDIEANLGIRHVADVPWYELPKPRRWHRCQAQTSGRAGPLFIERCACGGVRLDRTGRWIERNSR